MVELQKNNQSFHFKTEDENPKDFVLTYNGEDLAINTKGKFITLVDLECARLEVSKQLNLQNGK